jgi:type II secretory pathway component PulC/transposase InsO family protein
MSAKHAPKKPSIKLSPESQERIAAAALEHPDLGVRRLASMLKGEGVDATEGRVRTVLKKQNLHTRKLRLKLLEERHLNQGLILSEKQNRALHEFNPCLLERQLESHQPGLLPVQDIVELGNLENIGRTFLHAAIDLSCCLAFGALAGSSDPHVAMSVLNGQALAFYRKDEIALLSVLAGPGMFSIAGTDPEYGKFLKNQGITLSLPSAGDQPRNGFIQRFERLVRKDFLDDALRSQERHDLDALQASFEDWLERYNRETPLPGYPTMGRAPLEAFRAAAALKAPQEKTEDRPRPEPEPEPGPVSLPSAVAAAPSPPAPHAHEQHEWKPGREIWGFHAINAALICLLIYFGWLSASRLLDATWLKVDLSSEASLQQAPVLNYSEAQDRTSPLDEYHVVWDRNLFAVSRAAEVAARREKIAVEKIAVADRNVGLKLIGTVVTNDPKLNYAVIDVVATREQGIFREKDRVGKAVLKVILRNIVIIETEDGQRRRLSVDEELLRNPKALQAGLGPLPESPLASFSPGIIQGEGSTFQALREEVPSSSEDIQNFIEKFNLNSQDDPKKFTGFSVGRMRASYLLYQLGLRTGDVIKGLDDYEFSNPGDLEYFFQRLAQGGEFTVMVERRGQLQELNVSIE